MLPSRKIAAAFVTMFVIGCAVGGLVVWDVSDTRLSGFMRHSSDPQSMASRINQKYINEYHLSADEQAKIAPLTREMAQHIFEIRHQFGADVISTMDDYHAKIAAQMTPEHRNVYAAANAERKKWMTATFLPDQSSTASDSK